MTKKKSSKKNSHQNSKKSAVKETKKEKKINTPETVQNVSVEKNLTVNPKVESQVTSESQSKKEEKIEKLNNKPDFKNNPVSKVSFFDKPENVRKAVATTIGILSIAAFAFFSFYVIPELILTNTDDIVNQRKEKERKEAEDKAKQESEKRLEIESKALDFEKNNKWQVAMTFKDNGTIKINLDSKNAPKTVENFVRLAYRGYYNDTIIHRIVKSKDFAVIQGGDKENRNGQGGRSAFFINENNPGNVPDELWKVAPQFEQKGNKNVVKNKPEFRVPQLYGKLDGDSGTVEYRKGLIVMAKTAQANSAGSQFFITLDKTILPAQYTVFGEVAKEDLGVLDKIFKNYKPVTVNSQTGERKDSSDGIPNKDLIVDKVEILSPKV